MKPLIKLKATVPIYDIDQNNQSFIEKIFGSVPQKNRFFLGKILNPGQTLQKLKYNQDVFVYFPINTSFNPLQNTTLELEESLLVPIPINLNKKEALIAGSVALKLLNALFQKGKYIEKEIVIIMGLCFNFAYILLQLITSLKGTVFLILNTAEEFDRTRILLEQMNLPGTLFLKSDPYHKQILEKTNGIGVDIILDFHETHSETIIIKENIGLLAPNGRWVISDASLQLNPPEIMGLMVRNASLGLSWEENYGAFKYEIGKALNIIEQMMNFVEMGKIKIVIDAEFKGLEEWEKGFKEKKMIGSVVINLDD